MGSEQDRPVGPIDIRIAPHRLIPTNITSPTARLLVGDNERAGPDRNSMRTRSTSRPNLHSVLQTGAVGSGGQTSQKQIQSSTEDAESAPTLRARRFQRLLCICHSIAGTIATLAYGVVR